MSWFDLSKYIYTYIHICINLSYLRKWDTGWFSIIYSVYNHIISEACNLFLHRHWQPGFRARLFLHFVEQPKVLFSAASSIFCFGQFQRFPQLGWSSDFPRGQTDTPEIPPAVLSSAARTPQTRQTFTFFLAHFELLFTFTFLVIYNKCSLFPKNCRTLSLSWFLKFIVNLKPFNHIIEIKRKHWNFFVAKLSQQ